MPGGREETPEGNVEEVNLDQNDNEIEEDEDSENENQYQLDILKL
jgi:hypothetical protein